MNLNLIKPFAILVLAEADAETHLIDKDHYSFADIKFFDDMDDCMSQYETMLENGIRAMVLNTNALLSKFIGHQKECLAIELGIHEFESKGVN